ncbi:hypothetical protein HDR59_05465 [bacterium]|nr:hypothetical protein [bacterium]
MIFRNEFGICEEKPGIVKIIEFTKIFAQTIAPDNMKEKIDAIYENLTVVECDDNGCFSSFVDGHSKYNRLYSSYGCCFFDNVNTKEYTATSSIALRLYSDRHVIKHEALHAFSSEYGKSKTGRFYDKCGASYSERDNKQNIIIEIGNDLNEAITDALASRVDGSIGPGYGYYGAQVLIGDLLIGETVDNNSFIQDVYFNNGHKFAEDFDRTITVSGVKFAEYLKDFRVVLGNAKDKENADKLLMGAIEYNLKKAKTSEDIDNVYNFQKRVINFYKDGGEKTHFTKDEDIARLENILEFAEKIQNQCKLNLMIQNTISNQKD